MRSRSDRPAPEAIRTPRLLLEPLRVEHAKDMIAILRDDSLYTYTGGRCPTLDELRSRYERQCVGHSPDGTRGWLNWIVREHSCQAVVGTVQATLGREWSSRPAELAWVVGAGYQRRGYATEGAGAMMRWLAGRGVTGFRAYIHPHHDASIGVARRLGFVATDLVRDGEVRWLTTGACS
jgi:RimJ/RimL family protein N-acetyltransferase